jgi:pterin-4a-carbinolamine dehydratase
MPTVIREAGFEVRIYTLDHPPAHVHVWKAGAVVKIDLATHQAVEVVGEISDRDISRAERLVARNSARLRREWARFHAKK